MIHILSSWNNQPYSSCIKCLLCTSPWCSRVPSSAGWRRRSRRTCWVSIRVDWFKFVINLVVTLCQLFCHFFQLGANTGCPIRSANSLVTLIGSSVRFAALELGRCQNCLIKVNKMLSRTWLITLYIYGPVALDDVGEPADPVEDVCGCDQDEGVARVDGLGRRLHQAGLAVPPALHLKREVGMNSVSEWREQMFCWHKLFSCAHWHWLSITTQNHLVPWISDFGLKCDLCHL